MTTLTQLDTLLIDGDGVLYKASTPSPGLDAFIETLAEKGITWALVTNNATRTISTYVKKLAGYGIEADKGQIFSSGSVTAQTLAEELPAGAHIYVIGMDGLVETIESAGFTVFTGSRMPEAPIEAVVSALDLAISYDKLDVAMKLIRQGADFILTNPDTTYPTPDGLAPGAGALGAALEAATDVKPRIIGKPEPAIFEAAMTACGGTPSTTAIIGDRLNTDIAGGKGVGIGTILVFGGVTSEQELAASDIQPDYVFADIAEFTRALRDEL